MLKERELLPTQMTFSSQLKKIISGDVGRIQDYEAKYDEFVSRKNLGVDQMRVLSIDPGRGNMALIYWDGAKPHSMRVGDFLKEHKFEFRTTAGYAACMGRIIAFFLSGLSVDLIIKEGVTHYKKFGVADSGRIQQIIEGLAIEYDVPFYTVNPTTMRRFLKTNEKSSTKLAVYKRWGLEFASEDETDAFAIMQTGLAILRGEFYATVKEENAAKKAAKEKAA